MRKASTVNEYRDSLSISVGVVCNLMLSCAPPLKFRFACCHCDVRSVSAPIKHKELPIFNLILVTHHVPYLLEIAGLTGGQSRPLDRLSLFKDSGFRE